MACLLVGMQVLLYFSDEFFTAQDPAMDQAQLDDLNARLDSLVQNRKETERPKIYPFNPNYIADFKGFMLGMSSKEIDRLLAFRKEGNFVSSPEEFQRVTGVSDSLMRVISPHFRFADFKRMHPGADPSRAEAKRMAKKQDLNLAGPEAFKEIEGVGEVLSKRIVSYRKYLGGFSLEQQIYEVYNLPPGTAQKILERFEIRKRPQIQRININQASFKEILALPYIDYELTKRIVNFRDEEKVITDLSELKKIDSFPLDKFDRIALYLLAE